ncbi:hypothetical protein Pcinc_016984 [Petrolisthes cinctipes]|uniref:Uncharacterized protein n=1 Tax=Petrolisthes cinctipes TaxID=88211 RepID=A0AAE1FQ87_PETCI|nr:hypothetical protein Pcinc_016984 [Petrolisthes cinctipes]
MDDYAERQRVAFQQIHHDVQTNLKASRNKMRIRQHNKAKTQTFTPGDQVQRTMKELSDLSYIARLLHKNPIAQSHHHRQERGLVNFLGEISKALFGTAMDSDVQALSQKLNVVGQTVVNQVSSVLRTREDVKKKFTDFRSAVKKKAADIRRDSQETGGGPSTETKLNAVEEAMLGTLADVQVGGLPDIRDPGPSEHDTEEEDEVELPSVELPPGPSVPSVADPSVMIRSAAATSVVDTIIGTPVIPSVGSYQEVSGTAEPIAEHSYSEPSMRQSVPSQGSRVGQMTLAPEMLGIQTQILNGVLQISETLLDIAMTMKDIRNKYCEE